MERFYFILPLFLMFVFTAKAEKVLITLASENCTNADAVEVNIPIHKFNKSFAVSFTGDDALIGIYQRPFNYVLGRYVDDKDIQHTGMPATTGFTPTRMLTYTDGCGNNIPFRLSVNWMSSVAGKNIHLNGNKWTPQMWWSEAQRFVDLGNGLMNHGGDMEKTDPTACIKKTYYGVIDTLGIAPFVLGIPGGTTGFAEASETLDEVKFLESSGFYHNWKKYMMPSLFTDKDFLKGKFPRISLDKKCIDDVKETLREGINNGAWLNIFCHNIKNSTTLVNGQLNSDVCYALLDYLYDNYGSENKDCIWAAGTSEIYEYNYSRLFSTVEKRIENGRLIIEVDMATFPEFYFNELTLVIKNAKTISKVDFSENVVSHSWKSINETDIIVNFAVGERYKTIAEKYVSIAEKEATDDAIKDANLTINRLAPALKKEFEARLKAVSSIENTLSPYTDGYTITPTEGGANISGILAQELAIYSINGAIAAKIPAGEYTSHRIALAKGIYLAPHKKLAIQ
ncbi:MAG: hypothetical protein PHR45_09300 [Muribaculaceae bacterium]|nr:hypothetical protein [Muribaculaceae bacterium]